MPESSSNNPSSDGSDGSDRSDRSSGHRRLRPSGGYLKLRSFQVATLIYDTTASFCERFIDPRSRTKDQMVQAARSGRQNIAEGSRAAATSSQTELKLTSVARSSLDELLLDYEDFLRQRGLRAWRKDDREALEVRAIGRTLEGPRDRSDRTDQSDPPDQADKAHAEAYALWLRHRSPEVVANATICLIHQANWLLDQQIAGLELDFIRDGGYRERLAAERIAERQRQQSRPGPPASAAPSCPVCGRPMALRTAGQGANAGSQFWGCSGYPECRGTRAL